MQAPFPPIEVRTQLKILDLYGLYFVSALRKAWYGRMALALVLIILFAFWEGTLEFLRPLLEPPLLYVEITVILYSLVLRPYLASRSLIEVSSGTRGMNLFVFSEKGVDVRREHFEAHYDWPAIQRAKQSAHLLILYINPHSAIILPRRCFSNPQQLADFRTLLTSQMRHREAK